MVLPITVFKNSLRHQCAMYVRLSFCTASRSTTATTITTRIRPARNTANGTPFLYVGTTRCSDLSLVTRSHSTSSSLDHDGAGDVGDAEKEQKKKKKSKKNSSSSSKSSSRPYASIANAVKNDVIFSSTSTDETPTNVRMMTEWEAFAHERNRSMLEKSIVRRQRLWERHLDTVRCMERMYNMPRGALVNRLRSPLTEAEQAAESALETAPAATGSVGSSAAARMGSRNGRLHGGGTGFDDAADDDRQYRAGDENFSERDSWFEEQQEQKWQEEGTGEQREQQPKKKASSMLDLVDYLAAKF